MVDHWPIDKLIYRIFVWKNCNTIGQCYISLTITVFISKNYLVLFPASSPPTSALSTILHGTWISALRNHGPHSYWMHIRLYLYFPTCIHFKAVCVFFVFLLYNNVYWSSSSSLLHAVEFAINRLIISPCVVCVQVVPAKSRDDRKIVLRAHNFIPSLQLISSVYVLYVWQAGDVWTR